MVHLIFYTYLTYVLYQKTLSLHWFLNYYYFLISEKKYFGPNKHSFRINKDKNSFFFLLVWAERKAWLLEMCVLKQSTVTSSYHPTSTWHHLEVFYFVQ